MTIILCTYIHTCKYHFKNRCPSFLQNKSFVVRFVKLCLSLVENSFDPNSMWIFIYIYYRLYVFGFWRESSSVIFHSKDALSQIHLILTYCFGEENMKNLQQRQISSRWAKSSVSQYSHTFLLCHLNNHLSNRLRTLKVHEGEAKFQRLCRCKSFVIYQIEHRKVTCKMFLKQKFLKVSFYLTRSVREKQWKLNYRKPPWHWYLYIISLPL